MSHEYYRRGRNWFSAIGVLFCVMAGIVLVRQLLIWGPEFVEEFLLNGETRDKSSSPNIPRAQISTMKLIGFLNYICVCLSVCLSVVVVCDI